MKSHNIRRCRDDCQIYFEPEIACVSCLLLNATSECKYQSLGGPLLIILLILDSHTPYMSFLHAWSVWVYTLLLSLCTVRNIPEPPRVHTTTKPSPSPCSRSLSTARYKLLRKGHIRYYHEHSYRPVPCAILMDRYSSRSYVTYSAFYSDKWTTGRQRTSTEEEKVHMSQVEPEFAPSRQSVSAC